MGLEDVFLTKNGGGHVDQLPAIAYALAITHLLAAVGNICTPQSSEGMAKAQFSPNSLVSGVKADHSEFLLHGSGRRCQESAIPEGTGTRAQGELCQDQGRSAEDFCRSACKTSPDIP